jgi:hypothetical protein
MHEWRMTGARRGGAPWQGVGTRLTRWTAGALRLLAAVALWPAVAAAQQGGARDSLPTTGAVKGTVVTLEGRPVEGADVVVGGTAIRVKTRADGSFLLPGIPPGDYEILFRKLGYDPAAFTTMIAAGQQQEVKVTLARLGQQLDTVKVQATVFNEVGGVVQDTTGRPIAGADVEIDGTDHRMRTRADGRFLFLDVPPGRFLLRVRKLGFGMVRRSLEMAKQLERTITIVLHPLPQTLSPVEVIAQSGLGAADSVAQAEFAIRRRMAGSQSDMLVREDLAPMGRSALDQAIMQRAMGGAAKGLAGAACVLIEGQQPLVDAGQGVQLGMSGRRGMSFGGGGGNSNPAMRGAAGATEFRVLQTLFADQVESVELYPEGSEFSGTACARFPISMPQCGCDQPRSPAIVVVWLRK